MQLCGQPIQAVRTRIVKVDECGVPQLGAGNVIISKGFISIDPTPQYEDGDQFRQKNAAGELCVNETRPSQMTGVELASLWCEVNPDGIVLLTGQRLLASGGGSPTGSGVAFSEDLLEARASIEVWQPVSGGACQDGDQLYFYWAFPNVGNPRIQGWTMNNGMTQWGINLLTEGASAEWGTGPGTGQSWLPGPLEAGEHFAFNITNVPPPALPACELGAQALT